MIKSIVTPPERAWLDVDLSALIRNARRFQQLINAPLLPMVKAGAYGLGAIPVAQALERVEPWGYGVATLEEGVALRSAGITRPVLVFISMLPGGTITARSSRLTPAIGDLEALDAWLASGGQEFHIEIDTGMSRHGFLWRDTGLIAALADRLRAADGWEGVFTHFHSADCDPAATRLQAERFQEVLAALPHRPPLVHLSSSGGALAGPRYGADLARPGIFLYGGRVESLTPEPVAALRSRVIAVRRLLPGETVSYGATAKLEAQATIATLAIGYGDGVPRSLGNTGRVELLGSVVPIVGRVTMDMIMVRTAGADADLVKTGEVATVFGGLVSLDEQAALAGTISYELLTAISPRVDRRYRDEP